MPWSKRRRPPPPPPPATVPVNLIETFSSGKLDTTRWMAADWGAPGGGVFTGERVDLSMGLLCLAMTTSDNGKHIGGEVQSLKKYGYGSYEWQARMGSTARTPGEAGGAVSGGVSGLFNFYNDSETEIDFEHLGDHPDQLFLTNWNKPQAQGISQQASDITIPGIFAQGFHKYRYVWAPGSVKFYVDDVIVRAHTRNIPTKPAYIIMNHWGTNDPYWGGVATPGVRYMWVKRFTFVAA